MGDKKDKAKEYFDHLFGRMRFQHSWTHSPTSMIASIFTRNDKEIHTFASIRSPFFYLEHPQLYPLLYHEFAHVVLRQVEHSAWKYPLGEFYDDRFDLIGILKGAGHNQWKVSWDDFTSEVWADVMAVCLGGKAYLSALNAQLFGFAFNSHKSVPDGVPLEDLGKYPRELCEAPDTYGYTSYLWIARLQIAISAYKETHGNNLEPAEEEWLECLEAGLDSYCDSRNKYYASNDNSGYKSNDDENYVYQNNWIYQQKFNNWVKETCINKLKRHWKSLSRHRKVSTFLRVDHKVIGAIKAAVKRYGELVFGANDARNQFELDDSARIDSVPLSVKHYISKNVVRNILEIKQDNSIDKWTKEFVRHIRNDGQVAFRIAIEWWLARNDFEKTLAEVLEKELESDNDKNDQAYFLKAKHALASLTETLRMGTQGTGWISDLPVPKKIFVADKKIAESIRIKFRHGTYANSEKDCRDRQAAINKLFEGGLAEVERHISTGIAKWNSVTHGGEDRFEIGTMLLGALQPSWVGRNNGIFPAIKKARVWFSKDWNQGYKDKAPSFARYFDENKLFFCGMLGEYSFAAFIPQATPLELQTDYKVKLPQMVCKPRLVYRVWDSRPKEPSQEKSSGFEWMSLLRMRYRWEWQILRGILCNNKPLFPNTQLFLSSGWEQAIIFSSSKDASFFNRQMEKIRHLTGDTLTNFLFEIPSDSDGSASAGNEEHKGDVTIKAFKVEIKANMAICKTGTSGKPCLPCGTPETYCSIVDTTGRNDFLIQWPCSDPNKIAECINTVITPRLWEQITNFRTYAKISSNDTNGGILKFESEITFRTPSPWLT